MAWWPYVPWIWPAEAQPAAARPIAGGQTPPGPDSAEVALLALLREDLIGELQAITQYEAHAAAAQDPHVRDLLQHIARDEKEHVVELLRAVLERDPDQAAVFRRPPHG
jgi:hypothetical protein